MRQFNKRDMLIFVVCLLLGVVLIGWGMAHVIQLKQRLMPPRQTSALARFPPSVSLVPSRPVRLHTLSDRTAQHQDLLTKLSWNRRLRNSDTQSTSSI